MTNNDLDEQIDRLAVGIEEKISETEAFLTQLTTFSERSERSKQLQRKQANKRDR